MPEIVTSSLAVSPIQYGVLEYTEGSLTYNVTQVDVAGWAEKVGLTDPNLLDFSQYAEMYFADNFRRQVRALFADSDLTQEEIELLAETFAQLNQDYFAGRKPDHEKLKYGIGLWNEQESTFLLQYIKSIISANPNRTTFTITMEEAAEIAIREVRQYCQQGGRCNVISNMFCDKDRAIYDRLLKRGDT